MALGCLLLVVAAAPAPFSQFAATFPELDPSTFASSTRLLAGSTIAPDAFLRFVYQPVPNAPEVFGARDELEPCLKGKAGEGDECTAFAGGRFVAPGFIALVIGLRSVRPVSRVEDLVLITYSPQGEFIAALPVLDRVSSEAGGAELRWSIDGKLIIRRHSEVRPLDQPEKRWEDAWRIACTGHITRIAPEQDPDHSAGRTGFGGSFEDPSTHEFLDVLDRGDAVEVSYQRCQVAGKSKFLRLQVARVDRSKGVVAARFPGSPGEYALTYSKDRATLTCRNPDGTVQTFERLD